MRISRASRSNRTNQITRNHLASTYLLLFQQFLAEFAFHRMTTKSSLLRNDRDLILKNAVHNHVNKLNSEENIVKLGWTPTKDMIEKKTKELTKPSQKRLFPGNDDEEEVTTNIEAYTDVEFQKVFLNGSPKFKDLTDVTLHVMEYESNTNIQLSIINSRRKYSYCQYACCTHHNCSFCVSVKFSIQTQRKRYTLRRKLCRR
jgi:hypothetical protein